jgi:hypothetical protein
MEKIRLDCKAGSECHHSMKPTKALQIIGLTLCIAIICGCQKQEDKSGQESVRLLQDIKIAVSATHRKGEAFVVLKSDVVIYMADMQVLCFKPDFKQHFTQWKQDWDAAYQIQLRDFEAKNPELQTKLKSLDKQIAQALSKTNTVNQAASEAVADLAHRLESEKDALLGEQAKTSKAYEEYKQIADPFGQRLKDLQTKVEQIRTEQRTPRSLRWVLRTDFSGAAKVLVRCLRADPMPLRVVNGSERRFCCPVIQVGAKLRQRQGHHQLRLEEDQPERASRRGRPGP